MLKETSLLNSIISQVFMGEVETCCEILSCIWFGIEDTAV